MMTTTRTLTLLSLMLAASACLSTPETHETEPMNTPAPFTPVPARIIFFGDSITQMGQEQEDGYVNQLRRALADENVDVIGAGIGGHRVMTLEERFDSDVLQKHPTMVVIFIGINDIYYAQNHLEWAFGRYYTGMDRMITTMKNRNILPVIVIPSVIGEMKAGENLMDKELDRLGTLANELGKKHTIPVFNILQAFRDHLKENNPDNAKAGILTLDGIHLNTAGNTLIANVMEPQLRALLKANQDQLTISISPNEYSNLFFPDTRATISCVSDKPGATIRYTLDGKEPDKNSKAYESPIKLDKTTTIKAALFVQDKKIGDTVTGTFERAKIYNDIKPDDVDPKTLQAGGLSYAVFQLRQVTGGDTINGELPDKMLVDTEKGKAATIHCDMMKNPADHEVHFNGYIHIEKEGIYVFRMTSAGGDLMFDIENPVSFFYRAHEIYAANQTPGMIHDVINHTALAPGYYSVYIEHIPATSAVIHMFQLEWKTPGDHRFRPIPAERLFTESGE
ncbi:MAG: GDSL-type esterase/lipase family protein [Phycisphaerae bacterium]|nr:GDSL-type esterase/lipase family protein [Phycisphaerae bacterium]